MRLQSATRRFPLRDCLVQTRRALRHTLASEPTQAYRNLTPHFLASAIGHAYPIAGASNTNSPGLSQAHPPASYGVEPKSNLRAAKNLETRFGRAGLKLRSSEARIRIFPQPAKLGLRVELSAPAGLRLAMGPSR